MADTTTKQRIFFLSAFVLLANCGDDTGATVVDAAMGDSAIDSSVEDANAPDANAAMDAAIDDARVPDAMLDANVEDANAEDASVKDANVDGGHDGAIGCPEGFAGETCNECDDSHFGSTCQPVTCVNGECGAGSCSGMGGNGQCDSCDRNWAGDNCDVCDYGTFGPDCSDVTCVNGTCNPGTCSGATGNGQCDACNDDWMGVNCDRICAPFEVQSCYSGPNNTEGVGVCRAGYRVCHQSGLSWSPCFDEQRPRSEDICGNGLDDNCTGSQADEACGVASAGVWVDGKLGSDSTGTGASNAPYATIGQALSTGKKLIVVVSDGAGTVYNESFSLSSSSRDLHIVGNGPTRPTIVGAINMSHAYDMVIENVELRYPDDGSDPISTVRGIHNYRTIFRNVVFSAPDGLPNGKSLYNTHHGYDATFVDVIVDNVVLKPDGVSSNAGYALLNAHDHGTGSQFIRPVLGSVTLEGTPPETLTLDFIRAWGYCDQYPDGVTSIRNALITGLDMTDMATMTTSFEAIEIGCYLSFNEAAGFWVLNNTMADITADNISFLRLSLANDMLTWIAGNIVGSNTATGVTGVTSNRPATINYSNLFGVGMPTSGSAALGTGMLSVDPGFVGGGDYHLAGGSQCIDTGDPNLTDADTSRSDMGAYGGPLAQ